MKKDPNLLAAIERGRDAAIANVSQTAYQMAVSGEHPAMTMFWLKTRARWKEVHHVEVEGKVTLEDIVQAAYDVTNSKRDKDVGDDNR